MCRIIKSFKIFLCDADYLFLNYFVANIPCWNIRKLFYLIHGMKLGKKCRINMKCIIYAPWKVSIGANTIINEHVLLDGRGKLIIKDDVSVSMFSVIYTASHYSWSSEFQYYTKKTIIHSGVWIGAGTIIMPGSEILYGTIISANSVYNGGVSEKLKIYRGNPAQISGKRELKNEEVHLQTTMFFK